MGAAESDAMFCVDEHSLVDGTRWEGDEIPLQEALVVVRKRSGQLCILNHTARLIWEEWRNGVGADALIETLASVFDVSSAVLQKDIANALTVWEQAGLIGASPTREKAAEEADDGRSLFGKASPAPRRWHSEETYSLVDFVVRMRFAGSEIRRAIHPLVSHLAVPRSTAAPDSVLDIITTRRGYELQRDGELLYFDPSLDAVIMNLFASLMRQVYDHRDCLIGMHAAAVADHGRCIVMPGASGSGKSTLTAALLDAGLVYLGDDVITLERATLKAAPLPLALNLKPGSIPVLRTLFRGLDSSRAIRYGRRHVHYLPPPHYKENPPSQHYPVSHIVFPCYREGEQIQLRPLSAAEVLQRLIDTQSSIDCPDDISGLKKLLHWLEETPAFAMRYGSLPDAVEKILELL